MSFYDDSDFSPDSAIGYLLRRTHQLGGATLEPIFAAEGLTGTQWSALMSVWFDRGETAADLARDIGHDKGATSRLVDTLEARGWIARTRRTDDRRVISLSLTDEGAAVALRCKERVIACWNAWLADWAEDDVRTLISLLQKLQGTLTTAELSCG